MEYPESLQNYALEEIRRRIQTGVYPVGSKLAPQKIASELSISPTPVVAALNRLISQGLVEMLPRRGFLVKAFTVEDISNYFDTRTMMECWAVKAAIRNRTRFPKILAEMGEIVDRFDGVDPTDLETARELETQFHMRLIRMAGNDQLTRLYEFNWSVGSVFFVFSVSKVLPENFRISLQEHRTILEALTAGDEERLMTLLAEHLRFLNKAIDWYKKAESEHYKEEG
ncbi:MAG: GntR family transcriptional regulator [Oscillibacter sp.]|jgi:DNA-binding GntR family transcriptional regulator|nr:GntR family transcriptional regulator [Oscillibacter sp.]